MWTKVNRIFLLAPLLFLVFHFTSVVYAGDPVAPPSTLDANPAEIPADGVTISTITITLEDIDGIPTATGDAVELTSSDSTLVVSPPSATVDDSGQAVFTVTSTTPGTDDIDVIDTTTSIELPALGQVIFDPVTTVTPTETPTPTPTQTDTPTPTPTPTQAQSSSSDNGGGNSSGGISCSNAYPTVAPNLYSIVAVNNSATLYFAPPPSPFDGFTIYYGLNSNADSYSVSFSQGASSGAIKYTVNDLSPNTTYYFKVRANNGCAPGPWSSTVSSSNKSAVPVTGSSDAMTLGLAGLVLFLTGVGLRIKYKRIST